MKHLKRLGGEVEPVFVPSDENSELVTDGNQSSIITDDEFEIVLISAVDDCWVKFGVNPTASASDSMYMAAGEKQPFWIMAGYKISVYGASITITK